MFSHKKLTVKRKKHNKPVHTGDGGDHFSNLQPVQNSRFSCTIQPQDQDPHLSGAKQAREEIREETTCRIVKQKKKLLLRKVYKG